jgi:hypothetical protein
VSILKRPLASLVAVFLLVPIVPAHAQLFLGRTTVGAKVSGVLRHDVKRGSRFSLAQNGTAHVMCAYLDGLWGSGPRNQLVRMQIYRDNAGTPGARLAETDDRPIWEQFVPNWHCFPIANTPLTPGEYWLVLHSGGTVDGPARYYFDGTGNYVANTDSFPDGGSNPFGAAAAGNGTLSIYAGYDPNLRNAGRITVGANPSGALRGNAKRGSSFMMPQPGRVTSLTAYLDGKGATSGFQYVTFVLYADANGAPGPKVAEDFGHIVVAGDNAKWLTGNVPPVEVPAGKYWLVLHSSEDTRLTRYYADGTGNWRGNNDAYSDGASDPFGPSDAGNGTLSAFVSYEPTGD